MSVNVLPVWPPGLSGSAAGDAKRLAASAREPWTRKSDDGCKLEVLQEKASASRSRQIEAVPPLLAALDRGESLDHTMSSGVVADDPDTLGYSSAAGDILDFSLMSCLTSSLEFPLAESLWPPSPSTAQMNRESFFQKDDCKVHMNGTGTDESPLEPADRDSTPEDSEARTRIVHGEPGKVKTSDQRTEGLKMRVHFWDEISGSPDKYCGSVGVNELSPEFCCPPLALSPSTRQTGVPRLPPGETTREDFTLAACSMLSTNSSSVRAESAHGPVTDHACDVDFVPHRNGIHTAWRRVPVSVAQVSAATQEKKDHDGLCSPQGLEPQQTRAARVSLRRAPCASSPKIQASTHASPTKLSTRTRAPSPRLGDSARRQSNRRVVAFPCGEDAVRPSSLGADRIVLRRRPPESRPPQEQGERRAGYHHRLAHWEESPSAKHSVSPSGISDVGCIRTTQANARRAGSPGPRRRPLQQPQDNMDLGPLGSMEGYPGRRRTLEDGRSGSNRALPLSSSAARKNLARAARASKVGTLADPVTLYRKRQENEARRLSATARAKKDSVVGERSTYLKGNISTLRNGEGPRGRLLWAGIR